MANVTIGLQSYHWRNSLRFVVIPADQSKAKSVTGTPELLMLSKVIGSCWRRSQGWRDREVLRPMLGPVGGVFIKPPCPWQNERSGHLFGSFDRQKSLKPLDDNHSNFLDAPRSRK
jgi:hypothetical protein